MGLLYNMTYIYIKILYNIVFKLENCCTVFYTFKGMREEKFVDLQVKPDAFSKIMNFFTAYSNINQTGIQYISYCKFQSKRNTRNLIFHNTRQNVLQV